MIYPTWLIWTDAALLTFTRHCNKFAQTSLIGALLNLWTCWWHLSEGHLWDHAKMSFEEVCPPCKALRCHLYKGIWLALGLFLSLLGLVSIPQPGFTGGACGAFVCIHNMQFLVFGCLRWIVLNHLSILACRVSQEPSKLFCPVIYYHL